MNPKAALCSLLFVLLWAVAACDDVSYGGRTLSSWKYDLDADDDYKRRAACEALAEIGPAGASAIPRLVELLEDTNEGVQVFAEVALSKMGPEAVAPLETVLSRPEPELRMHAAAALVGIDPQHKKGGEVLAQAATGVGNAQLARMAQAVMVRLGEPAVPLMLPYLDDPYEPVRLQTTKFLGKLGKNGNAAVDALTKKLETGKSTEIRIEALKSLVRVGTREQVEPVLKAQLDNPIEEIGNHAGAMLQYIGARESASGNEEVGEGTPTKKKRKSKKTGGKAGFKMRNK